MKIKLITLGLLCSFSALAADSAIQKDQSNDALHMDWLNTSMSPNQDFYSYANGTWLTNNPIPADYSAWGSFNIVHEKVQNIIHQMLVKASENTKAAPGSIEQKVGDFYYSGMDEAQINQLGVKPLEPIFSRIAAINNLADLQRIIPYLHNMGVDPFFDFGSMQDYKHSEQMIAAATQGGLGLPDRDYYLKDDAKFKQIREAYVNHIAKMFELLGDEPAQAATEAKTVMDIETKLAKVSMSQVDQRNPYAVYHMTAVTELDKTMPNLTWSQYLTDRGQGTVKQLNLAMPEFFKALNTLLQEVSLADWKTYLRWQLVDSYASYLSKPFVDENFKMVSALSGAEKILPRWKRVVSTEEGALGFAIGKLYVDEYFTPQAKQEALGMLTNIRAVLHQDISTLKWMTPDTRKAALHKLDMMELRVGYPSKWRDYSTLKIDRGPYVENVMRANEFLIKRDLNKIGKPVDRTEWGMTPQTINAYYDPSMNSINIPAGILQPPYFTAPFSFSFCIS